MLQSVDEVRYWRPLADLMRSTDRHAPFVSIRPFAGATKLAFDIGLLDRMVVE
jgi:hypothetical protein